MLETNVEAGMCHIHLQAMNSTPWYSRVVTRLALLTATLAVGACSDPTTASPDGLEASLAKGGGTAAAPTRTNTLAITVSGLPAGTAAGLRVTGSNGYSATVNTSTSLSGLANATYTVAASSIVVNGSTYTPSPTSQSANLKNGTTRNMTVAYAVQATTGNLTVTVGMPDATPAAVTVTGPNGFLRSLTGSQTLSQLAPGSYTVAAVNVTSATGVIYGPSPATQTASVTVGNTASATVSYTATGVVPGGDFNIQILGMTLTQAVQKLDNSITLIAGRAAMLRVFPVATAANTVKPTVRVRLYQNGVLQSTLTATSTGTSVPTAINQGSSTASWNVAIPGTQVQPGLTVLADVDPENSVVESSNADNTFPATGTPQAFTIRAVPALNLTFVPVTQSSTGGTGAVSSSNVESFLQGTRDMLPVNVINPVIRAPYTTSQNLISDGGGWSATLGEVYSLRNTDRSSNHYYGVVKVGYSSGVAGMGYIGAPASIGWDYLPSGSNTLAHELGHNYGRYHAPCGGVSGADTNFPHAGGVIGVFGFNTRTNAVIANTTADLMGYCSPRWISDYNFNAMMNYRGFVATGFVSANSSTLDQPSLLVWGRVEANGAVVLEPAMRINARSVLPTSGGDYTVTATDDAGANLFSLNFTPVVVADEEGGSSAHFSFVVPMNDAAYEQLARLEVSGRGRSAERVSRQPAAAREAAARGLDIAAEASARARLRWNASAFPMIMVREAATGNVLSFARGGDVSVVADGTEVDVVVSDGLKSATSRVRVRGR